MKSISRIKTSRSSSNSSNDNDFDITNSLRYTNVNADKDEALIQKHTTLLSKEESQFNTKDEEYWEKKELEQNRRRIARWDILKKKEIEVSTDNKDIRKERCIKIFNLCLHIAVIFTGVFNFYSALNESFQILGENMRLEYLRKRGIHNCDAFLINLSILKDIVHVLHAFFSAALLFATSKENGSICVFWIVSQAAETCLFLLITAYNLRFHQFPAISDIAFGVYQLLAMDIFGTIFILLRYYQLTNPFTERKSKLYSVGSKKVLNFEIVFVHLPQFLQDKVSFRQAANYETMMILKSLYGDHRIPMEKPNKSVVDEEVNEGLTALKAVASCSGIKKLRELKLRRQNMPRKSKPNILFAHKKTIMASLLNKIRKNTC